MVDNCHVIVEWQPFTPSNVATKPSTRTCVLFSAVLEPPNTGSLRPGLNIFGQLHVEILIQKKTVKAETNSASSVSAHDVTPGDIQHEEKISKTKQSRAKASAATSKCKRCLHTATLRLKEVFRIQVCRIIVM